MHQVAMEDSTCIPFSGLTSSNMQVDVDMWVRLCFHAPNTTPPRGPWSPDSAARDAECRRCLLERCDHFPLESTLSLSIHDGRR